MVSRSSVAIEIARAPTVGAIVGLFSRPLQSLLGAQCSHAAGPNSSAEPIKVLAQILPQSPRHSHSGSDRRNLPYCTTNQTINAIAVFRNLISGSDAPNVVCQASNCDPSVCRAEKHRHGFEPASGFRFCFQKLSATRALGKRRVVHNNPAPRREKRSGEFSHILSSGTCPLSTACHCGGTAKSTMRLAGPFVEMCERLATRSGPGCALKPSMFSGTRMRRLNCSKGL